MQASTGIASAEMCPHAGQVISQVVVTERFAFTLIAWQPMREVVREAHPEQCDCPGDGAAKT
jgi:hypothetical protein